MLERLRGAVSLRWRDAQFRRMLLYGCYRMAKDLGVPAVFQLTLDRAKGAVTFTARGVVPIDGELPKRVWTGALEQLRSGDLTEAAKAFIADLKELYDA